MPASEVAYNENPPLYFARNTNYMNKYIISVRLLRDLINRNPESIFIRELGKGGNVGTITLNIIRRNENEPEPVDMPDGTSFECCLSGHYRLILNVNHH